MVPRARPRQAGRHNWLPSDLRQVPLAQRVIVLVTLTVVALLLLVSGRRHSAGRALQVNGDVHDIHHASGHTVQFMDSQHNLKRSNLLETPTDPSKKIFSSQAVPYMPAAHSDDGPLNLTGDGFLSNVAEANRGAVELNMTSAPSDNPSGKPLGYYFAKDIPGHVKEKALGIRLNTSANMPRGGKAAMGAYFNANLSQLNNADQQAAAQLGGGTAATSDEELHNQQQVLASIRSSADQHSVEPHYTGQTGHGMNTLTGEQDKGRVAEGDRQLSNVYDDEELQRGRSSLLIAIKSHEGQQRTLPNIVSNSVDDTNQE